MESGDVFAQFHVPIGKVDKMFPAVVMMQAEIDLHERPPFRALGLSNEMHDGFLRSAIGLARVTLDAGTNDILPGCRTTPVPRDHMIQV